MSTRRANEAERERDEALARVAALEKALRELDRVHARLIAAVTPGDPGWINAKGPHSTPEDNDRYDALFSEWHTATRGCRAALAAEETTSEEGWGSLDKLTGSTRAAEETTQ